MQSYSDQESTTETGDGCQMPLPIFGFHGRAHQFKKEVAVPVDMANAMNQRLTFGTQGVDRLSFEFC